jgi:hypothetical protein
MMTDVASGFVWIKAIRGWMYWTGGNVLAFLCFTLDLSFVSGIGDVSFAVMCISLRASSGIMVPMAWHICAHS